MSDTTETHGTTDSTSTAAAHAAPLQMLQLPGLAGVAGADADVPVCGPDGCAVPAREAGEAHEVPEQE